MTWIRLDPKRLRNTAGDASLVKRVYGEDGKAWPRLVLSIYCGRMGVDPAPIDAFKVACCTKQGGGEWWEDCDVPMELMDDLILLLSEVRVKLGIPHRTLDELVALSDADFEDAMNLERLRPKAKSCP